AWAASCATTSNSSACSRGWPSGHLTGITVLSVTKDFMQAEHHHFVEPSATPFWFGSFLMVRSIFGDAGVMFIAGFAVFPPSFSCRSPSRLQNRQPFTLAPPITADAAAEGLA